MKILILAGGGGTRLYPLSTPEKPKQFLPLFDNQPLIISTIKRFLPLVSIEDILIVTGQKYHEQTKQILEEYGFSKAHIVCEPCARNTAPAIALGVKYAAEKLNSKSGEIFFIAPSDHAIRPQEEYVKLVQKAAAEAEKTGQIVILGIKPTQPETGFGYINAENTEKELKKVLAFKEKPDKVTAAQYLKQGNYYWNAGMYCFSRKTFEAELQAITPEFFSIYNTSYDNLFNNFESCPKLSIDTAIAEKSSRISMLPLTFFWSDLGTWDAYYNFCDKDENGNVIIGKVSAVACKNCLIYNNTQNQIDAHSQSDKIIIAAGNMIITNRN